MFLARIFTIIYDMENNTGQKKTVAFVTFGCKVNNYDSSAMAEHMRHSGYDVISDASAADIVVVNSCTVTATSDQKLRQSLRAVRRNNPHAAIVLAGCFPQAFPSEAAALLEADIVTGTADRAALPQLVGDFFKTRERNVSVAPHKSVFEQLPARETLDHTRVFLKIEDGCDNYCGYCIIPFARGGVRSMPLADVAASAAAFARAGYKEIVLTGINLSCYGLDLGLSLADAAEAVAAVDGVERMRLGSIEPDRVDDASLARLAATNKLCAHFHLSLQSGCDETLSRMGRRYDTARYQAVAELIRKYFPSASFTTDVMVGYPGETDEAFGKSLAFVSSFGFLKCHVFPYSRRPGTRADKLPDQIDQKTKTERAAIMQRAADEARERVLNSWVGKQARVLLEQPRPGGAFGGYTDEYLPARVYGEEMRTNQLVVGRIGEIDDGHCIIRL